MAYVFNIDTHSDTDMVPWLASNVGPKVQSKSSHSFTHWQGEGWDVRYVLDGYTVPNYYQTPKSYWIVKIDDPAKAFMFKLSWNTEIVYSTDTAVDAQHP